MNYKEIDNKKIQSFEYESTVQSDGAIIGVCELGKVTIQLINESNNYSDFKNSWINTVHGSFYVYDVSPVQEKINIKLDCYDIKYKLDKPYDSTKHHFPCTLKEWRNSIFDECDVEYDNSDFPHSSLVLNSEPYVGKNPSNREVMCLIGVAGCSFIVVENDKFYFKWLNETTTHVVKDWEELTTEKTPFSSINCVVLGRGDVEDNVYYPTPKPQNPIEFRIDNNYILDPQQETDVRYDRSVPIFNRVNGLSYVIFNMRTQHVDNKLSIKLGDKIKYTDIYGNELESYVLSRKINYLGGELNDDNSYEITLSASELKETSTDLSYASNIKNDILDVQRLADKINGEIKDVITLTNSQNQKISQVIQTVGELNSKISDIADITTSGENTHGIVELNNINISEPIRIEVRPLGESIAYLYPANDLFPSNDLFLKDRIVRFENKNTNEVIDYELPNDLWYISSEYYDEFILDYDLQKCMINKKVKLNEDGTLSPLIIPQTIEYDFPHINLTDGDYKISLPGYNDGYLFVRLMAQNIYTTQFATRAELRSSITQTSNTINLELSKKLDSTEFNGASIKMAINQDSSSIKIDADNLDLKANDILNIISNNALNLTSKSMTIASTNFNVDSTGNVTCSNIVASNGTFNGTINSISGKIGGWDISSGGFSNGNFFVKSNGYSNIYTYSDLIILQNCLNGTLSYDGLEEHYDVNGDGVVDIVDLLYIRKMILGEK